MAAATKIQSITIDSETIINVATTTPVASRQEQPTLVFLHFWGGSSRTWSQVIGPLSSQYPTVAIDFRGWGSSVGPSDPQAYSIKCLAKDVTAVIGHLGLSDFVLVGHSMGAKVAQAIAGGASSKLTEGIRGMVLIAPAPPSPFTLPEGMREQQIHAYEYAESAEFVAQNVLTASDIGESAVQALVQDMLRGNEWARAAWPAYAMAEDVCAPPKISHVPCTVIAADEDVIEPVERIQKEVLPRFQNAALVVVKKSGHMIPIEAPMAIVEHITQLLTSLR
ncbi:hypothetical protein JX266_008834 [Neoarthrinium moseri]|nr:hypothetical protein JX266_008834 [Neoarthrinium moseri]